MEFTGLSLASSMKDSIVCGFLGPFVRRTVFLADKKDAAVLKLCSWNKIIQLGYSNFFNNPSISADMKLFSALFFLLFASLPGLFSQTDGEIITVGKYLNAARCGDSGYREYLEAEFSRLSLKYPDWHAVQCWNLFYTEEDQAEMVKKLEQRKYCNKLDFNNFQQLTDRNFYYEYISCTANSKICSWFVNPGDYGQTLKASQEEMVAFQKKFSRQLRWIKDHSNKKKYKCDKEFTLSYEFLEKLRKKTGYIESNEEPIGSSAPQSSLEAAQNAAEFVTYLYAQHGSSETTTMGGWCCSPCECMFNKPKYCEDLKLVCEQQATDFRFRLLMDDVASLHRYSIKTRPKCDPESRNNVYADQLVANFKPHAAESTLTFGYTPKQMKKIKAARLDFLTFAMRYSQYLQNYNFLKHLLNSDRFYALVSADLSNTQQSSEDFALFSKLLDELISQGVWLEKNLSLFQSPPSYENTIYANNLAQDIYKRRYLVWDTKRGFDNWNKYKADLAKEQEIVGEMAAAFKPSFALKPEWEKFAVTSRAGLGIYYDVVQIAGTKFGAVFRKTKTWAIPPLYSYLAIKTNEVILAKLEPEDPAFYIDQHQKRIEFREVKTFQNASDFYSSDLPDKLYLVESSVGTQGLMMKKNGKFDMETSTPPVFQEVYDPIEFDLKNFFFSAKGVVRLYIFRKDDKFGIINSHGRLVFYGYDRFEEKGVNSPVIPNHFFIIGHKNGQKHYIDVHDIKNGTYFTEEQFLKEINDESLQEITSMYQALSFVAGMGVMGMRAYIELTGNKREAENLDPANKPFQCGTYKLDYQASDGLYKTYLFNVTDNKEVKHSRVFKVFVNPDRHDLEIAYPGEPGYLFAARYYNDGNWNVVYPFASESGCGSARVKSLDEALKKMAECYQSYLNKRD